jgi:hypothetical protein
LISKEQYILKTLHFSIIVIFCSFVGVSFLTVSAQVTSEPAIAVHYQFSQMASSENNVYVTYQENIGNGAGASVFFRKSSDSGSNFDKIIPLSSTGHAGNPLVAASGNNVYVAWMENWIGTGNSYVMFERSSDNGNTFSAPVMLSNKTDGDANIQQIIASGNNVYVLIDYALQGNTVAELSFRASHDNGTTFGNSIVLLEDTQTRGTVDISASQDGKTIYAFGEESNNCPISIVNCEYQLFLRKSTDDGLSFTKPILITTSEQIAYTQIATSEHDVYLVWGEQIGDNLELFLAKSNDDGITFSKPVVLSQKIGNSSVPQIVTNGKNLFVVWDYSNESIISNERYNNSTMIDSPVSGFFFTKSFDGGNTFSNPINLSGAAGTSYWSNIAASGNNVFVSWGTKFGDKEDVFIRKSMDSGTTFNDAVKLTDAKQDYFQMQMISSGNNVYVAIDAALPGDDLFLTASNDNGNTFGNMVNLNHEISVPEFPFAIPVLLVSITSLIVFYRIKS